MKNKILDDKRYTDEKKWIDSVQSCKN